MSERPKCIRDEPATREKYNLVGDGNDLPRNCGVSWCGRVISNEFFLMDESHALLSLRDRGDVEPCHECLRLIRDVVLAELGEPVAAEPERYTQTFYNVRSEAGRIPSGRVKGKSKPRNP